MPLTLKAPGTPSNRSKVYRVRGTYRGKSIDRTTETASRVQAQKILNFWKDQVDAETSAVAGFGGQALTADYQRAQTKRHKPLLGELAL